LSVIDIHTPTWGGVLKERWLYDVIESDHSFYNCQSFYSV